MLPVKIAINSLLRRFGYHVTRFSPAAEGNGGAPARALAGEDAATWQAVAPYTMVPPARIQSLADSVRYVVCAGIEGAFIECGVWKGGSAMCMALTLKHLGVLDRDMYLYDTYDSGWPPATERDVTVDGKRAHDCYVEARAQGATDEDLWAQAARVREALNGTGYPSERIHLVEGLVEETLPGQAPEKIALLRLDTDWYASTRHELLHLYPRLAPGGVLILDDYGLWQGARQATDEYFEAHGIAMLLHRVDESCRIGIKT